MQADQQCPLCGIELSKTKFAEIQSKVAEQERQKLSEQQRYVAEAEAAVRQRLEQKFKKELQKETEAAAKLTRQQADKEISKMAAERDQAAEKLKASAAREAEIRKQAQQEKEAAAKSARQEAEKDIAKFKAERDKANKKVQEAEAREVEIRKEARAEAEKKRQVELAEQRNALERDRDAKLLKQQADFNRERESLQKKAKVMEHQLQKKTANELGDGAEVDIFEALRAAFPGDRITRVLKGQAGADILCEVLYKGQSCGKIIIDSKNRQAWQNVFVTKLRQDQVDAKAEHAILASTVFPAGKKEMCIESDVIVVNPARVVHIAEILRSAMVMMHVRGLSIKERTGKMSRLYALITSDSYSRKFSEAGKLTREILELDVQEKKAHDNVWKKRGTVATRINHVLREIETDVAAVIEADDGGETQAGFGVERVNLGLAKSAV
jgi:hypothetical protein